MPTKTNKITDIEREEKLKNELKELRRKRKEKEKQKQQKTLLEIGAVCEKVLGRKFGETDIEKLHDFLVLQEKSGQYYSTAMNKENN